MSVPFPTPRLRAVFGTPLDETDRSTLERLIALGVDEEFDLEFKAAVYTTSNKDKHELAKDVAAMTERGGIIILGLAQQGPTAGAHLVDVELGDAVAQRVRQVIASRVAPMPEFELLRVPPSAQNGQWLIVVPASPFLPHAVSKLGEDEGLHYFTRNGTTTRELNESEVAERYRRRFAAGEATASRATDVFDQGVARLALSGKSWLAMALVPDRPGIVEVSRTELERHRRWSQE